MRTIVLNSLLRLLLLSVAGCACTGSQSTKQPEDKGSVVKGIKGNDEIRLTGKMHLVPVENGCWEFISADSTTYELVGEGTASLQKEGLRASVVVRPKPALKSVCMVGRVVELLEVLSITEPE